VRRPLWFVLLVLFAGTAVLAALFGTVRHHVGWVFPLFTLLTGVAGGIFGWVLAEEFGRQRTLAAAAAGFLFTAAIYVGHRYVEYALVSADFALPVSFWRFLTLSAEAGARLTRRPGSGDGVLLGETLTWGLWVLDFAGALVTGAAMGKFVHIDLRPSARR
jgi:hypothetical protein